MEFVILPLLSLLSDFALSPLSIILHFPTYVTSQSGFETTIGSYLGLHAFPMAQQMGNTIPHVTKGVLLSNGLKLIRVMKGVGESLGANI